MRKRSLMGLGMLFCLILGMVAWGILHIEQVQPVFSVQGEEQPVVILDPGHGGIDGGAEANNLIEKDINLAIALNLRDFLSVQGFRVIMTREDDRSIHDQGITQISRQKRSDMYNRLAIIEDHPEAIFVSIHQNKFEQASVCGAQVFYSQNHPDSQQLAQQIQTSFASLLQPDNTREIKPAENNLFLLYEATVPAVMVECGFLSNAQEAANLSDPDYQRKVAFVVGQALCRFVAGEE